MSRFINKYRILLSFVVCYALTTACVMDRSDDREIFVQNNSSESIYSILSPDDTMFGLGHYEEFREGGSGTQPGFEFHFAEIKPGMSEYQHDRPLSWDDYFEKIPGKNVRIYIVNQDLVKKFGWKKIFNENIYTKKIMLSQSELEQKNWVVNFQ